MRLFKNRRSNDKDRWSLFRWTDIIIDGEYLTRFTIFKTPWCSLKLHWIFKPDPDRGLHTHPWWFVSLILRGGYEELTNEYPWDPLLTKRKTVNWLNYKNTVAGHRIVTVKPKTLTLVFSGPRTGSWGFYDDDSGEFKDYKDYHIGQEKM